MTCRVAWILGGLTLLSACKSDDLPIVTAGGSSSDGETSASASTGQHGETTQPTTTTLDPSTTTPVDPSTTSGESTFEPTTDALTSTTDVSTTDVSTTDVSTTTGDTDASTTDASTGVVELCPNGVVDPGEECDDDNDIDTDACTIACLNAVCGDGIVRDGVEECDDQNDVDTDDCLNTCVLATCGDGIVQAGVEGCDDANMVNDDACTNDCVPAMCGDGIVQAPEECDDMNADQTDACLDVCTSAVCGDGFIQAGVDTCDDGGFSPTCDDDCTPAMCGDGLINPMADETCDDSGESVACDSDCTAAMCGDGHVNAMSGEICDDMGESFACDSDCTLPMCGDGVENNNFNEDCDTMGQSATCDADCTDPICGDGTLNMLAGEGCDDGNSVEGDGCSSTCTPHKVVFATTQVFDGNMGGLAGADAKCQAAAVAAGLPGTYLAWLSDNTGSPATRFTKSMIPYVNRSGVQVADNWADVVDGTLDFAINKSEFNTQPGVGTASCPLNFPDANPKVVGLTYTGTGTNGTLFNAALHCNNWSSNSANDSSGGGHWSSYLSGKWTTLVCVYGCHNKEALYCFQQ